MKKIQMLPMWNLMKKRANQNVMIRINWKKQKNDFGHEFQWRMQSLHCRLYYEHNILPEFKEISIFDWIMQFVHWIKCEVTMRAHNFIGIHRIQQKRLYSPLEKVILFDNVNV